MTPIQWQEVAQNPPAKGYDASSASKTNLWFTVSIGLMGIILGFAAGRYTNDNSLAANVPQPVAARQAPLAPPTPPPQVPSQPPPAIDLEKDHIRGDLSKAKVAAIEYSDFECPFCKRVHPTYQQILKAYGDKVVWVYRHFPLSFHANAQKEDEATECASELGGNDAFWKYADKIFERTTSNGVGFPLENLVPLAKEIGLNEAKFKSCLDSGKYAKHVQEVMAAGQTAGVDGTPANFLVNLKTQKSQLISGAQPFSSFQSAIDSALNE